MKRMGIVLAAAAPVVLSLLIILSIRWWYHGLAWVWW